MSLCPLLMALATWLLGQTAFAADVNICKLRLVKDFFLLDFFEAFHQGFEFPALSHRPFMALVVNHNAFFMSLDKTWWM